MTNRLFTFILLIVLTVMISCNKSDEPEPQAIENKIPKIKTEAWYSNGTPWGGPNSYEYDQEGRIKKRIHDKETSSYQYQPGKVIIEKHNTLSNKIVIDTLLLNEKGLVIGTYDFTYEYDSEGYRTLAPDYLTQPTSSLTLTILNGNMIKSAPKYWNAEVMASKTYKFGSDLNTIGEVNNGIAWNGKQNKNLMTEEFIKTVTTYRTYEQLRKFTYEFDDKNRVTKKTITEGENEAYILYTYY